MPCATRATKIKSCFQSLFQLIQFLGEEKKYIPEKFASAKNFFIQKKGSVGAVAIVIQVGFSFNGCSLIKIYYLTFRSLEIQKEKK